MHYREAASNLKVNSNCQLNKASKYGARKLNRASAVDNYSMALNTGATSTIRVWLQVVKDASGIRTCAD